MSFYALSAAWLALLIPPLIMFYFLKLKRPRLEVPSLVLWKQVLNDNRVNSPFQRFKRNILLILQLILLTLLILAAMQPFFKGGADDIRNTPILIDCSASMSALDKRGGISRLEAAKRTAQEIIDGLLKDQQVCLIAFAKSSRKLTGFTNNKRVLTDALNSIQIQDVPSDIEDAMRMVQALSRSQPFDEVLLLSDGNFPAETAFDLPFSLKYQRLDQAAPNTGITALNARHAGKGAWDVFVSVETSSSEPLIATIEIMQDGQRIGLPQDVTVSNDSAQRLAFDVAVDATSTIEVRLKTDGFDSLGTDNIAYLNLSAGRKLWVYVPTSLDGYRNAFRKNEDVRLFPKMGQKDTEETDFDLVITENLKDIDRQAAVTMVVGQIPSDLGGLVSTDDQSGTSVIDWQRNTPMLKFVELTDLVVLDNPTSKEDVREGDYENLGYETLAYGERGPLILRKLEGEREQFFMLFHSDRSTLPYRVGFPIMLTNLVQLAMDKSGLAEIRGNQTGVLPKLAYIPETKYRITGPGQFEKELTTDEHGLLFGVPAVRVGHYEVREGSDIKERVGVSLLNSHESTLATVEKIRFNEDITVEASAVPLRVDKSLWPVLAILALIMLAVEWWFYQRRPGGMRA